MEKMNGNMRKTEKLKLAALSFSSALRFLLRLTLQR